MKKRPLIGLITITLGPLADSYLMYLDLGKELNALGVEMVVFTPYGINWRDKTIRGMVFKKGSWQMDLTDFPDVVYNRLYGTHPRTLSRLEKALGRAHVYNHNNRLDKLEVDSVLRKSKLKNYLPATTEYSWNNLLIRLQRHRWVILKPIYGHYGIGVFLVRRSDVGYEVYIDSLRQPYQLFSGNRDLQAWVEDLVLVNNRSRYIIQQWIRPLKYEERFFDLRTLLQRNHVGDWEMTATLSRINRLNYFISNYAYDFLDGRELLDQLGIEEVLLTVAKTGAAVCQILNQKLGTFAELSVDWIIDSHNRPWIIEINGKPRKDLFAELEDEETLAKIYLQPIVYGRYLAQNKERG